MRSAGLSRMWCDDQFESCLSWIVCHERRPSTTGATVREMKGGPFEVSDQVLNTALASIVVKLHITTNWSLAAKFYGEFALHSQTYAGTGTLRYTW